MPVSTQNYISIKASLDAQGVTLVAVSKTKPIEDILELYQLGQRDFGENYVQELVDKQAQLPKDIRWHFIGHLQSNKVKYIAPFVHLIHGVDSAGLLKEINKQAVKNNRTIDLLLQVYIASEESKFGLDGTELTAIVDDLKTNGYVNVRVLGLMGMASFTENQEVIRAEFKKLKQSFDALPKAGTAQIAPQIVSMGMSADYPIAIQEGSNMVRIGSLLFGSRN
jgi:PLP dependent protein